MRTSNDSLANHTIIPHTIIQYLPQGMRTPRLLLLLRPRGLQAGRAVVATDTATATPRCCAITYSAQALRGDSTASSSYSFPTLLSPRNSGALPPPCSRPTLYCPCTMVSQPNTILLSLSGRVRLEFMREEGFVL